jgi:hypothetical protein
MDGESVDEKTLPPPCEYDTSQMYSEVGAIDSGAWGGTWGFFKGFIDEVSIWNVPLTPEQVKEVHAKGLKGDEPGLVGLWLFDEDGQTVQDSTAFTFHDALGNSLEQDPSDPERVAAERAEVAQPAPRKDVQREPVSIVPDEYPGETIFVGRYHHASRGQGIDEPSELFIKQSNDGSLTAVANVPFMESTSAAVGDPQNRFVHYAATSPGRGEGDGYSLSLDMQDGSAFLTVHSAAWDIEKKKFDFSGDAQFDPNSRPDAYLAANILLRGFDLKKGETKEVEMFDVDKAGTGLVSYRVKIENVGKEEVSVPAGVFEANHIVLTQLTSADTWFKKRADHVTDFWTLDNGVIVRVLRHREPYEMQLLDWQVPEKLPGQLNAAANASPGQLSILSALYGAGDAWVDVTKQLNDGIKDNTLTIRATNEIGGDPIDGTVKTLNVHYKVGDKVFITSVDELEMLQLPLP